MWQERDCLIWWRKGMLDADMALYIKTIRFVRRTPFQIKVDFFLAEPIVPNCNGDSRSRLCDLSCQWCQRINLEIFCKFLSHMNASSRSRHGSNIGIIFSTLVNHIFFQFSRLNKNFSKCIYKRPLAFSSWNSFTFILIKYQKKKNEASLIIRKCFFMFSKFAFSFYFPLSSFLTFLSHQSFITKISYILDALKDGNRRVSYVVTCQSSYKPLNGKTII